MHFFPKLDGVQVLPGRERGCINKRGGETDVIGVDVSKAKLDCAWLKENNKIRAEAVVKRAARFFVWEAHGVRGQFSLYALHDLKGQRNRFLL